MRQSFLPRLLLLPLFGSFDIYAELVSQVVSEFKFGVFSLGQIIFHSTIVVFNFFSYLRIFSSTLWRRHQTARMLWGLFGLNRCRRASFDCRVIDASLFDENLKFPQKEEALRKDNVLVESLRETVTDLFEVEIAQSTRHFFRIKRVPQIPSLLFLFFLEEWCPSHLLIFLIIAIFFWGLILSGRFYHR